MRSGRPKAELVLTQDERESLEDLARRRKTAQALALRAGIVLACAEGRYSGEVARSLKVTPQTVGKWRSFCSEAVGGSSGRAAARRSAQHQRCPSKTSGDADSGESA